MRQAIAVRLLDSGHATERDWPAVHSVLARLGELRSVMMPVNIEQRPCGRAGLPIPLERSLPADIASRRLSA